MFGKFGLESAHKYKYGTLVINTFLIYLEYIPVCLIRGFLTCKTFFVLFSIYSCFKMLVVPAGIKKKRDYSEMPSWFEEYFP